ncbi:MAG: GNAT family N-acetyltransferase [Dermatophilaceae bacterium]
MSAQPSAESVPIIQVHGAAADPVEHARFDAFAQVYQDATRHDLGDSDAWTADELRAFDADVTRRRVRFAALDGDLVCGSAEVILPVRDNLRLAYFALAVLPGHRRRGIGTRLLEAVEGTAAAHGRTSLMTETSWVPTGEEDPSGHFAHRHGYAPAQTVRRSDYTVPEAGPEVPPAPQGYAVETHVGTPPEADLADRAWLVRRMSTDAPLGDLDIEEEDWDEDRVRASDVRLETMGRGRVGAFARHLESGRLVAFSEIQVPATSPHRAYHQDTLVLREHRGHGLGLVLKLANVPVLRQAFPQVRTVRTWNAVENAHMLAVNDAMGYATSGFEREWQKRR